MNLPNTSSNGSVVSICNLGRSFGKKRALEDVSLHIPKGCVFGLVGENGAGKTTLINHIMGLLNAEEGSVRIFGLNPVKDSTVVLQRTGYLSEYRDLPMWMRVDELLRYTEAFYPGWDSVYAETLRDQFGLDPLARVQTLSQGQQAKAGLLLALSFRPELLVLDEPSSGLDPVVRRDILEAIITSVGEEGRTVFFSSHLLDEVERVSDQLAMIRDGRIIISGTLDQIVQAHRRYTVRFERSRDRFPVLKQSIEVKGQGKEWSVLSDADPEVIRGLLKQEKAVILNEKVPTLDEIFVARAGEPAIDLILKSKVLPQ